MSQLEKRFDPGWWLKLSPFFLSGQFRKIGDAMMECAETQSITPKFDETFRAFSECPYKDLKVVLLGLDPYPGKDVADGLAFSARNHQLDPPKSLKYILDAIEKDVYGGFGIGFNEDYLNTDLSRWANQGILLINTALSTVVGKTGEHLEIWAPFTQYVFRILREFNTGIVFILLGAKAKQWAAAINKSTNYVLTASHPSHCSYAGLKEWDCNHVFSQTNEILKKNNKTEILW